MNFLIIFLLLLISVVFISYMELGQTHLKSSQYFKETKRIENQGASMARFSDVSTMSDLEDLFLSRADNHNGSSNQYLISINTSPLDTQMLRPNNIKPKPFFYDTYYNFSEYDFYHISQNTTEVKGYTFIRERPCTVSAGSTHCREFEMVTVATHLQKMLYVSRNYVKYNFTLTNELDGTTTTYYNGFEVKEIR